MVKKELAPTKEKVIKEIKGEEDPEGSKGFPKLLIRDDEDEDDSIRLNETNLDRVRKTSEEKLLLPPIPTRSTSRKRSYIDIEDGPI